MQTSLFPSYQPARSVQVGNQPRFGGILDGAANAVGLIGSNRNYEMVGTDAFTMIIPRSLIGFARAMDDGLETMRRELSGLFFNIFAIGAFSHLAVRAVGNNVNRFNVHGIPGKAYISEDSLNAFGHIFDDVLDDPRVKTPRQARARFLEKAIGELQASDYQLRDETLLREVDLLEKPEHQAVFRKRAEAIARLEGRLKPEVRDEMIKAYALDGDGILHTTDFGRQAWQTVRAEEALRESQGIGGRKFDPARRFLRERLRRSREDLAGPGKRQLDYINEMANNGGLTDTVQLPWREAGKGKDAPQHLLTQSRKTYFQEMKYFLEQVVDRVTNPDDVRLWAERAGREVDFKADWKSAAREMAYAQSQKHHPVKWLLKWLPQADDGLISAIKKSKSAYLTVPFALTLAGTMSMAYLNNWLTKRKYGGKAFFPGEMSELKKLGGVPVGAGGGNAAQSAPMGLSRRYGGAFSSFQRGGA